MEQDNDFEPDGFGVQESRDGRDLRIVFTNGDAELGVAFPRQYLPVLLSELHEKAGSDTPVPIRPQNLQIGGSFGLQGWQVAPRAAGGVTVTLFVELPAEGRVVTLPIDMPPDQLDKMLGDIAARRV